MFLLDIIKDGMSRGSVCRYQLELRATNPLGHSWLGDLSDGERAYINEVLSMTVEVLGFALETDPIANGADRRRLLHQRLAAWSQKE